MTQSWLTVAERTILIKIDHIFLKYFYLFMFTTQPHSDTKLFVFAESKTLAEMSQGSTACSPEVIAINPQSSQLFLC